MTVPENDRGNTGSNRIDIKLPDIVKNVQGDPGSRLNQFCDGEIIGPRTPVHIPPNSNCRCGPAQFLQNIPAADVACMQDKIDACQLAEEFGPNESV